MERDVLFCAMNEQRARWIDKSGWPPGPWMDEPDRIEWVDDVTGLPVLMLRQASLGHWCGYVAVPPGHRFHGKDYDDVPWEVGAATHGGITHAGFCMNDERPQREQVCHVPKPGEPDDVWWFGFDCAHAGDLMPHVPAMAPVESYRDEDYVRGRVTALAKALNDESGPAAAMMPFKNRPDRIDRNLADGVVRDGD